MPNTVRHRRGLFFVLGFSCAGILAFVLWIVSAWYTTFRDVNKLFHARSYLFDRMQELARADPATEWESETVEFDDGRVFTLYVRPTGDRAPGTPILITWPPESNRTVSPYIVVGYADGRIEDVNSPEEWDAIFRLMTEPPNSASAPAIPAANPGGG